MPPAVPPTTPGSDWRRWSKNISFWILLVLVSVALFQISSGGGEATREVKYSEYSKQLENQNISKVTVEGGRIARGEFKDPVTIEGRRVKSFTATLPVANSDAEFERLRAANLPGGLDARDAPPSMLGIIISVLPWVLFIGVWFFLMRQMQAGAGKAFSFGKSKAKLLTGDTPKVTFADVAGCDEAKVELQEIIEFLKDPQKFTKLGGRLPEGRVARGSAGHGQDAAREGGGGRGRAALLLDVGVGLRRDVRWRRCEPRARPVRAGEVGRRRASSSSTKSTPLAVTAARDSAVGTTNGSRRSINCWSRWTGSSRTRA